MVTRCKYFSSISSISSIFITRSEKLEYHSVLSICKESTMQIFTIILSFVGLFSAAPQYYLPYTFPISYEKYLKGFGGINYASIASSSIVSSPVKANPNAFSSFDGNDNVDIITQTRRLSNALHNTLTELASDPDTAEIVNGIITENYNTCIHSLEDGIASIETATGQLERAGGEVRALITKVKAFVDLKDPREFVSNAADILRILGPLMKNIGPVTPVSCQVSADQEAVTSITSLGELMDELSNTQELGLSQTARDQLKTSSNTISAVTSFTTQLRSTLARFENICTADKQGTLDYINAMGDIMVNLADLLDSIGGSVQTGENLRKGKAFVAQITVSKNVSMIT